TDRTGCRSHRRIHGDECEKAIFYPKGAPRIKSEPSDKKNEYSQSRVHLIVPAEIIGRAVAVVFADPRFQEDGGSQGCHGACQVNNRGTGKVLFAVLRKPAPAPD